MSFKLQMKKYIYNTYHKQYVKFYTLTKFTNSVDKFLRQLINSEIKILLKIYDFLKKKGGNSRGHISGTIHKTLLSNDICHNYK